MRLSSSLLHMVFLLFLSGLSEARRHMIYMREDDISSKRETEKEDDSKEELAHNREPADETLLSLCRKTFTSSCVLRALAGARDAGRGG